MKEQSKRYRRAYYLAVSLALLLILVTQSIIQYSLAQKKFDAQLINTSGRQRMYCQRVLSQALACQLDIDGLCQPEALASTYQEWMTDYEALKNADVNLPRRQEGELTLKFIQLDQKMAMARTPVEEAPNGLTPGQIKSLEQNQEDFLMGMEEVVVILEKGSTLKLNRIIRTEVVLAVLALIVILFEIRFIFQPLLNRLQANVNKLTSSQQLITQYAYVTSSGLQKPLQRLMRSLSSLRPRHLASSQLDKQQSEDFEEIENSALEMQYIIRDMVTYTEAIKRPAQIASVDCWQLLNQKIEEFQEHIHQSKATIHIGTIPKIVQVDAEMFALMWQHLIQNALQYARADVNPEIIINGQSTEEGYEFSIRDNGIGISPEAQDVIFQLFRRIGTVDHQSGVGLGLALCKQIVEKHNGRIRVESTDGFGSTFHLFIPKARPQSKLLTFRPNQQQNDANLNTEAEQRPNQIR
ncbi:MAG: ATP-binding protein [Bacteroidota bacterium]